MGWPPACLRKEHWTLMLLHESAFENTTVVQPDAAQGVLHDSGGVPVCAGVPVSASVIGPWS